VSKASRRTRSVRPQRLCQIPEFNTPRVEMDTIFEEVTPKASYRNLGCVAFSSDPCETFVTATAHLLLSLPMFRNYLINKKLSTYEYGQTGVVSDESFLYHFETLAAAVFSNSGVGATCPVGFLSLAARTTKSVFEMTPPVFINKILTQMGESVCRLNFGDTTVYQHLLATQCLHEYSCNLCGHEGSDLNLAYVLTLDRRTTDNM
jgi:hypothetical protein